MDLKKSGGPAHPTLNGAVIDDNTYRFEGMTLFDFYVGQFITKSGITPKDAVKLAVETMQLRNSHLLEKE
jgi:hypothetical protein